MGAAGGGRLGREKAIVSDQAIQIEEDPWEKQRERQSQRQSASNLF